MMVAAVAVMVVVGGCAVAVEVAAEVADIAEAQTFSSLLPSFMFIVGVAGSWCRLLVTEWAGMSVQVQKQYTVLSGDVVTDDVTAS